MNLHSLAGGAVRGIRRAIVGLALAGAAGCTDGPTVPSSAASDPSGPGRAGSVLVGASLYVDPHTGAARQAAEWGSDRPADALAMRKIADTPQAIWLGDWSGEIGTAVDRLMERAEAAGQVPVLVVYNIPVRDCGGHSGGGGATTEAYRSWVAALARGIGNREAVIVLEPDAVASIDCLSSSEQDLRLALLSEAVKVLTQNSRSAVYLDAGHARWHSPEVIADRLRRAGIAAADGFSLNVSNFFSDGENAEYGARVSALLSGKHFVIDSSRNGAGPTVDADWCNPPGRALGTRPTTRTAHPLIDAFLWIKRPGESDGPCNGGPEAGSWWAEYALGLARRAGY